MVFLTIIVIPLGGILTFEAIKRAEWSLVEARIRELQSAAAARDGPRPVLRGQPVPGNAWDDYDLALRELDTFPTQHKPLWHFANRHPEGNRDIVKRVLETHPAVIDHLRRGASRAAARNPQVWNALETGACSMYLDRIAHLLDAAVCKARILYEDGHALEGARLALDTCQFARDLGHNSLLGEANVAQAVDGLVLNELRTFILAGSLSSEELLEVGRELAILDEGYCSTAHWVKNDLCMTGVRYRQGNLNLIMDHITSPYRSPLPRETWRYGLSPQYLAARAFNRKWEWMQRYVQAQGVSWEEEKRVVAQINTEAAGSNNILDRKDGHLNYGYWVGIVSECFRYRRAELRLLRTAVHYRATGKILELEDPFGGHLRHTLRDGTLTVWSIGHDGTNTDGSQKWTYPGSRKGLSLNVPR